LGRLSAPAAAEAVPLRAAGRGRREDGAPVGGNGWRAGEVGEAESRAQAGKAAKPWDHHAAMQGRCFSQATGGAGLDRTSWEVDGEG
jgi:hypothetical protein